MATSAYYNYYTVGTPNDGIRDVKQFKKIVHQNTYPSIDIEFLASREKGFEYNFILQPKADMNNIVVTYSGALELQLKENKLHINLATNDLIENIPASFTQKTHRPIDVRYSLVKTLLRFSTDFDTAQESIIIDPTPNLVYATYFGGATEERAVASKIEYMGNVDVTGHTNSVNNIATSGAFQSEIGGTDDILLMKFNSAFQLDWATYMGGSDLDYSSELLLAQDGVVIVGLTLRATGIASDGAFQTSLVGGLNAYFSWFDTSGNRVLSSYFGTGTTIFSGACILDDNILLTFGSTQSSSLPFVSNPFQPILNGIKDGMIVQWDLDGNPLYCSYFGGEDLDVIAGGLRKTIMELFGRWRVLYQKQAFSPTVLISHKMGGGSELMLIAFSSDFEPLYGTYFGSTGNNFGGQMTYKNGKIVNSGATDYGDLLPTPNAY